MQNDVIWRETRPMRCGQVQHLFKLILQLKKIKGTSRGRGGAAPAAGASHINGTLVQRPGGPQENTAKVQILNEYFN